MTYAVIAVSGKQYRVSQGDILDVDRLPLGNGASVTFDQVLLIVSDGQVRVGRPKVPGVSVYAKVLENKKGEKIRVAKYKAKARYRRVMGFRPQLTRVQIEKIEESKKKA